MQQICTVLTVLIHCLHGPKFDDVKVEMLMCGCNKCLLELCMRHLLCVTVYFRENIGECLVFKWIDVVREFLEMKSFNTDDQSAISPTANVSGNMQIFLSRLN